MKPALLIIDVQNQFFETSPETADSLNEAINGINDAIGLFREKALPIFCIQNVNPADNLTPGSLFRRTGIHRVDRISFLGLITRRVPRPWRGA